MAGPPGEAVAVSPQTVPAGQARREAVPGSRRLDTLPLPETRGAGKIAPHGDDERARTTRATQAGAERRDHRHARARHRLGDGALQRHRRGAAAAIPVPRSGAPRRPLADRRRPQSPVRRDLVPRRAGLALTRRRCLRIDRVDVVGQLRDRRHRCRRSATGPGSTDKRCVLRRPRYAAGPRPHPPRRRSSLRSAARRRHRARRLAAALRRRPGGRRPDDGARSRVAHHRRRHAARADLSRRCRGVGAGRGRGRTESAAQSQFVLDGRGEPAAAGRLDRTGAGRARRRDSIADQGAPAEGDGAVPCGRPAARRRAAGHDASGAAPAAVRGRRGAADRLRQRVEPVAVPQRRSPARRRDADHARRLARTAGASARSAKSCRLRSPAASSVSASPGWQ